MVVLTTINTIRIGATARGANSQPQVALLVMTCYLVMLTVIHDGFSPGSGVLRAISQGWPAVLSSLKTLLETGAAYGHRPCRGVTGHAKSGH